MSRLPLSAGLLALSLFLSGCGEDQPATAQTPAATPAPAPSSSLDQQQAKAVVTQYANLAFAVFSDALSSAQRLQQAIDRLLANPDQATLAAAREAWRQALSPRPGAARPTHSSTCCQAARPACRGRTPASPSGWTLPSPCPSTANAASTAAACLKGVSMNHKDKETHPCNQTRTTRRG